MTILYVYVHILYKRNLKVKSETKFLFCMPTPAPAPSHPTFKPPCIQLIFTHFLSDDLFPVRYCVTMVLVFIWKARLLPPKTTLYIQYTYLSKLQINVFYCAIYRYYVFVLWDWFQQIESAKEKSRCIHVNELRIILSKSAIKAYHKHLFVIIECDMLMKCLDNR